MRRYRIGVIDEPWIDLEPPISRTDPDHKAVEKTATPISPSVQTPLEKIQEDKPQSVVTGSSTIPSAEWLELRSTVSKQLKSDGDNHTYSSALDHLRQLEIDLDLGEYPAVDAQTQQGISAAFQDLHQDIRDRGLYTCRLSNYAKEMTRYFSLFCLFVIAFRQGWVLTSAVFLGLFWHQIMFSAHDAGHLSITQNFKVDTTIGIIIADALCGLSLGWHVFHTRVDRGRLLTVTRWKSSHNVHHLVPNHPVSQLFAATGPSSLLASPRCQTPD